MLLRWKEMQVTKDEAMDKNSRTMREKKIYENIEGKEMNKMNKEHESKKHKIMQKFLVFLWCSRILGCLVDRPTQPGFYTEDSNRFKFSVA